MLCVCLSNYSIIILEVLNCKISAASANSRLYLQLCQKSIKWKSLFICLKTVTSRKPQTCSISVLWTTSTMASPSVTGRPSMPQEERLSGYWVRQTSSQWDLCINTLFRIPNSQKMKKTHFGPLSREGSWLLLFNC